jgi:hypothetical protein
VIGYIIGDVSGTFAPMTTSTPGATQSVYGYTFTYNAATMTAWGGSAGTINFKVTQNANWTPDGWGAVNLTVGGAATAATQGATVANAVATGLVDGTSYTITATTTATGVSLAIN